MNEHRSEVGFTLIEMLIALGLFALIALEGFGLIESILATQARTSGRLDRLAAIQRTMVLVSRDFEQIGNKPLLATPGAVTIARHGPHGSISVGYALVGDVLERRIGVPPGAHAQRLLDHVADVRWNYLLPPATWLPRWPPEGAAADIRPAAVSLMLELAPADGLSGGEVRRLVILPTQP